MGLTEMKNGRNGGQWNSKHGNRFVKSKKERHEMEEMSKSL
jgi:phage gp16-like protein